MRRRRLWWGGGALLVVIVGATLLTWRPWRLPYGDQVACAFYRENPKPGQPMCITWGQAKSRYSAWVRQPTWLPPTTEWQALTVDRPITHIVPPPGLTILYQLPLGAEIQVQENPTMIDGGGGPHTHASRLDGQLVYVSGWTNADTHLKSLYFDEAHHWYDVMGINTSWTDVDGVAASLIK